MVKTLIIGAGTAGLSCGRTLETSGEDYLIVDSKKEIGRPYRSTYGISTYWVNKYGMPGNGEGGDGVVASYIDSIRLETDERHYDIDFGRHVGIVYDPAKYEPSIARGLNIQMQTAVTSIRDGMAFLSDGSSIKADNIVVAAGPTSHLIPKTPEYQYPRTEWIAAYEESRKLPKRTDVDLVLHFSDTYAPGGYVWDFPSNNGLRRIGIGIAQAIHRRPVDMLHAFDAVRPEQIGDVDHTISHVIPLCPPPRTVVFGNVAYIGESARTTFASTGGGLQGAWHSGMLCGKAIADGNMKKYQKMWSSELYGVLRRHYKIKNAMYKIGQDGMNELLSIAGDYRIRSENANKEIPRLARYLMIHKPSLIPKIIGLF